jgi:hypothetical protein
VGNPSPEDPGRAPSLPAAEIQKLVNILRQEPTI